EAAIDHPPPWYQWEKWSSYRMLAAAYQCADAARHDGGKHLLRKIARIIAADHSEAIRYEPSLQDFFPEPVGTSISEGTFWGWSFVTPSFKQLHSRLPPEDLDVIRTISRHVELLQIPSLLNHCCDVSEAEAYDLMLRSRGEVEVLEAGVVGS